jgi:hypothetical protein
VAAGAVPGARRSRSIEGYDFVKSWNLTLFDV